MANKKIGRDMVPEDFTTELALVDLLPVLFFGINTMILSRFLHSGLFLAGAVLCFGSGLVKVLWKMIVAVKRKNIWVMFLQMRIIMPAGFLIMLVSVVLNRDRIHLTSMAAAVLSLPSAVFFALAILGMCLMAIFSVKLDSSDKKSNWVEQMTNGISQLFLFIGLLFLL